ncbi:MAG: DNA double-strand break repair nuclease NurA [Thaumarchaeota archaeon]|nr:DNA double-strand break repair nuclease NurA [Nitrososphaerota archaeon]
MTEDPVKSLIGELGAHLTEKGHVDVVLNSKGNQYVIEPAKFEEIKGVSEFKKIAFVDGGDGPLDDSPNFLITINRVYFSLFQGKKRIRPKTSPRLQFFSYVVSNVGTEDGKKKVSYQTRLFVHDKKDYEFLPSESDLESVTESTTILQEARLNSLARRFAEWQMAIRVVEKELEPGDVIVMDGSLQTSFKNEVKYANRLYDVAEKKGVIVCGLAKTSRLITEAGDPLLARVSEIAENVKFGKWFIRVAEEVSSDDRGFMLVAKFHPKSSFVFRFEVLREQFQEMSGDELNSILASLAENAQDVSMLGYPYGAIDADRFAQVRMDELAMYKGIVLSEMLKRPEWKKLQRYSASMSAHDVLNGVTS